MWNISRRVLLAAGGTLVAGLPARKLLAAPELPVAQLTLIVPPIPLPATSFRHSEGVEHKLEEFRGRGMVINFWATWCAPCAAEMPSLARLAETLAPHNIAVIPLSSDRGGIPVVQRFFEAQKISGLPILHDPSGAAAQAFEVKGLPTTVIVDRKGFVRARLNGGADWSTTAVAAQIRQLVD